MPAAKRKKPHRSPDEPHVPFTLTHYCSTGQHSGCDGGSLNRLCICDCHNADELAEAQQLEATQPKETTNAST